MSVKSGKNLHIVVAGLGYWGPNLVRNFVSLENTRLSACDILDERRNFIRSRFPSVPVYENYDNVISDPDVDGVVLATPIETHFELAKQALRAGKHVLVEKPMTMRSDQIDELADLAKQHKLVLMAGHTFMFSPPVMKVSELVRQNELGKLQYIALTRINLGRIKHNTNVLWDLAPHDFSIILDWTGKLPQKIEVMGKAATFENNVDVAFVNLHYDNDLLINIHMSWLSPVKVRQSYIIGDRKMVVYDDTHHSEKVKIYDMGVDLKEPDTFGEWQLTYRSGDVLIPRLDAAEPLRNECQHFIDCIRNGKEPKTGADHAKLVVRMIEAAQESLQKGGMPVNFRQD